MEEALNSPGGSQLHSTGDYVAIVQGAGNATVNVALPPLKQQWLKPARQTLIKPFVGRQQLVDELIAELTGGKNVTITGKSTGQTTRALQGMGGIGKTYLALKLAGELYDRFPGGVIRIDVGPQVSEETSTQIPLGRLASYAFGGIAPQGPFQPELVAAWLDVTAPGPFLVIFDDLWHPAPLRLLSRALPPQAVQLVTTRFANVAQAIGANIVPLDRLSPGDGLALLEDRLHCQGDTTHQTALEAIVKLLGGHALALELAAAQIKKPSHINVVLQALQQGIGQGKLDNLQLSPGQDREENLARSFALSYERMTPAQQRLFRALGVFAEESMITPEAATAIWGMDNTNTAQRALFELTDLALLTELEDTTGTPDTPGYQQHGLLRLYARALMEQENELLHTSRTHAQFYTDRSWQAMYSSPKDYEILDQHLPNLLAALQWSENNDPSLFASLLDAIDEFLLNRGQFAFLEPLLPKAVNAAHLLEDKIREANLLRSLGDLETRLGNLEQARAHYDAALPLFRAERNRLGEANTLKSLGDLELRLGHLEQARAHYDAALPLYRAERARLGEANTLRSLGDLETRLGKLEQARAHYDAALPLYRAERARLGEASTLRSLGDLETRLGHLEQARAHYDAALPLYRAERNRLGEANTLRSLGDLETRLGHLEQARAHYDAALPLYRAERNRLGEANTLRSLGDLETRLGNLEQARAHYDAALLLYRAERTRLGEANTLRSLGDLETRLGNLEQARAHYDAALLLYRAERTRLGEANTLKGLGDLETRLGNLEQARAHYDAALPLYRAERARLGEANVYTSLGDMYIAQEDWKQARKYYEQALPLLIIERAPTGQANTLIDLGRARFELGDHEQGMKDEQQAEELYRHIQRPDWAERAEQYLAGMRARLKQQ